MLKDDIKNIKEWLEDAKDDNIRRGDFLGPPYYPPTLKAIESAFGCVRHLEQELPHVSSWVACATDDNDYGILITVIPAPDYRYVYNIDSEGKVDFDMFHMGKMLAGYSWGTMGYE